MAIVAVNRNLTILVSQKGWIPIYGSSTIIEHSLGTVRILWRIECRGAGIARDNRFTDTSRRHIVLIRIKAFAHSKVKPTMQIPKIEKIILNMGVGEVKDNPKALDNAMRDMGIIAGQKPVATVARKSVAAFKLREGMKIGCKVTLRGENMYYFLDKLISNALPRVRDFRGINPNSFDGHGNYAMGVKEQLMFPEIDYDKIDKIRGMDIIIVTTANTDEEAFELLKLMGMPFHK